MSTSAANCQRALIFADLCASVSLYEKLGENEALPAVERCVQRMQHAIALNQGKILQVAGDELSAVFNSADAAAQAAVEMQLRIDELPALSGHKLAVRIGLDFGVLTDQAGATNGEVLKSAARVAGIAQAGEILSGKALVQALSPHTFLAFRPKPEQAPVLEHKPPLALYQLFWQGQFSANSSPAPVVMTQADDATAARLCVRYHGRAFLLDDKSPMLSLGRDPGNELVIQDRKASRLHARIERRADRYYFVDISTNGSFVTAGGGQEVMVRRHDLLLEGRGRICFGSSSNDPSADCAEFEHL